MSEMIERVARAIAEQMFDYPDGDKSFHNEARAAIAAMREPTEAMQIAAIHTDGQCIVMWQAMIDAALSSEAK